VTTGEVENTLVGHAEAVFTVAFSPDGQRIASGSYDKTIKLWGMTPGKVEKTLAGSPGRGHRCGILTGWPADGIRILGQNQ